jgi:hypothetical protein
VSVYFLLICRSAESESKVANVRRENKLYSYQEQMAEIELKKVGKLEVASCLFSCQLLVLLTWAAWFISV